MASNFGVNSLWKGYEAGGMKTLHTHVFIPSNLRKQLIFAEKGMRYEGVKLNIYIYIVSYLHTFIPPRAFRAWWGMVKSITN